MTLPAAPSRVSPAFGRHVPPTEPSDACRPCRPHDATWSLAGMQGLRLRVAAPAEIRAWSHGEVTRPAALDARTETPVPGGLCDEAIFGARRAWQCGCGWTQPPTPRQRACPRCGQPVGAGPGQRDRFGHIELAAPCTHPWFTRGTPNRLALLLDCPASDLAAVLTNQRLLVTTVDEAIRRAVLTSRRSCSSLTISRWSW